MFSTAFGPARTPRGDSHTSGSPLFEPMDISSPTHNKDQEIKYTDVQCDFKRETNPDGSVMPHATIARRSLKIEP